MPDVASLVSESVTRWDTAAVERAVFGTDDGIEIGRAVNDFCESELGSAVADGLFYSASSGCVLGVRLTSGTAVVIKAYQARWHLDFLQAVREVQSYLEAREFPCPRPIRGPTRLGRVLATVEQLLSDPGPTSPLLEVSACGLARQVALCLDLHPPALGRHPLHQPGPDALYPEPHSPVFDFRSNASAARWIDEYARAAQEVQQGVDGQLVVAHTDWAARNVRMSSSEIIAVYDWDSLAFVPEATAVGQAAAVWSNAGEAGESAPTPDEIVAFTTHYEATRGVSFSKAEWRGIGASAVWVFAYAARCEHAIDPDAEIHTRARDRLESDGRAMLSLG